MHLQHYLLYYDIADKQRLAKVQRAVCQHMVQVQYSLYYAETMPDTMSYLAEKLRHIIDPRHDDIRIYMVEPLTNAIYIKGSKSTPELAMFDSKGRPV